MDVGMVVSITELAKPQPLEEEEQQMGITFFCHFIYKILIKKNKIKTTFSIVKTINY
jgi:hypothetical protein